MTGLTERLADFSSGLMYAATRPEMADIVRLCLLDWSAVALAGRGEPAGRIAREMVLAETGAPESSLLGASVKVPARAAALANGTISHALDYDDTHFGHVGHVSVAVIPAALALAERQGASGADLMAAIAAGSEVACRVGAWFGRAHYEAGFHQTATSGTFGATAAAARILGLDPVTTAHAIGIAASRATGLRAPFGTMGKPLNAGLAASNGIEAALLAANGFQSRRDALECAGGFSETHAGDGGPVSDVLDGLGARYLFTGVQFKLHACCHGLHAALEALAAIRTDDTLDLSDVARVTIIANPRWASVCNKPAPATGLEAKFSFALTAAMALAGVETAALETYDAGVCVAPPLVALRDRVTVHFDPDTADTASHVTVHINDGATRVASHDLAIPMTRAERQAKVLAKARTLLGEAHAERLWTAIQDLDSAGDLSDFINALAHA
ncbi:MAG: MmgE/PrpD family protein [Pseudomonadota bacterium]